MPVEVASWALRLTLAGAYVGFLVWLYRCELAHWQREHGDDGRTRLRWAVLLAPLYVLFLYETRHRREERQASESHS